MALRQCRTADILARKFQFMTETRSHGLEHANGLFGNFRSNPVSAHHRQIEQHATLSHQHRILQKIPYELTPTRMRLQPTSSGQTQSYLCKDMNLTISDGRLS